jgi:phytoene dehydrogenase-like protein
MTMINIDKTYDVIVVGGGHNGLVCATYLAKDGRKVLVVEANDALGGASATSQFADQFSVSSCAHWLFQLNPDIARAMGLSAQGMELAARDLSTIALAEDGNHLCINGDNLEGANISQQDRKAFVAFNKQMLKFCKLLAGAFNRRAPKLVEGNLTDRLTLAKLGLGMKMLGKEDMSDLMRLALINIYDVMEENFDNQLLKVPLVWTLYWAPIWARAHPTQCMAICIVAWAISLATKALRWSKAAWVRWLRPWPMQLAPEGWISKWVQRSAKSILMWTALLE